ncbi:MAG TPA: hypothetical protein VHL79_12645 [Ramlibacter sp.]|jgi:hypothetical protein|nr:hypothetical protein [Ramlibacter sp.]
MKRSSLTPAWLLAGVLAASGAAQAALDDVSVPSSGPQMQTWYFPDGSNHTVLQTAADASSPPDTTVLGAGPAPGSLALRDEAEDAAANVVTQTWIFPDGSNHTVMLPGESASL